MSSCLFCRPLDPWNKDIKDEEWTLDALKGLKEFWKLCKNHIEWVDQQMALREKDQPKKYILKQNLPPIVQEPKSFYEREPGQEG